MYFIFFFLLLFLPSLSLLSGLLLVLAFVLRNCKHNNDYYSHCVSCRALIRDLLFGPLYDTFSGEGKLCKRVFLETLYSFVTDKKLDHTHDHTYSMLVFNRISSVRTLVAKDLIGGLKGGVGIVG